MTTVHKGNPEGQGLKVGIAVARFNETVTLRLLDSAVAGLLELGVHDDDIHVAWVPGAFEIPGACRQLFESLEVDAVIGLGAIIRGETSHYDYVCYAATDGMLNVGVEKGRPAIFGVLTTENEEQALARSGGGPKDKGLEAARCAIEMCRLYEELHKAGGEG